MVMFSQTFTCGSDENSVCEEVALGKINKRLKEEKNYNCYLLEFKSREIYDEICSKFLPYDVNGIISETEKYLGNESECANINRILPDEDKPSAENDNSNAVVITPVEITLIIIAIIIVFVVLYFWKKGKLKYCSVKTRSGSYDIDL